MKQKLAKFLTSLPNFLSTKRLSYGLLAFFVLESLWVAISARYPQAFDEDFHFGIIQVYSHYWLPFLSHQPAGADAFGAVYRDPSYLYHYLMSFPYRALTHILHTVPEQVVALRIINIALFTSGLALFVRLLQRIGLSRAATNVCLLIMVFIPVAPQVAGQINYDNLVLPLAAAACQLTCAVISRLQQGRLPVQRILQLLAVCCFASLVKYEFMPIFMAIILFLVAYSWRKLRTKPDLLREAGRHWLKVGAWQRYAWLVLLVLGVGMLLQRDGLNLVQYHNIAPACRQVISESQCGQYPVWLHDSQSHKAVLQHQLLVNPNPINYALQWLYWLWFRLFFVINGPINFVNYPPLPLPAASFGLLALASFVALARNGKRLFTSSPYIAFVGVVVGIYGLTLLLEGYLKYLDTGVLELMNGRLLFPILLPAIALSYLALRPWLRRRRQLRSALTVLIIICCLQGGGVLTFILRSDSSWDWPNSAVVQANNGARRVLQPVIIEGSKYYNGHVWYFN